MENLLFLLAKLLVYVLIYLLIRERDGDKHNNLFIIIIQDYYFRIIRNFRHKPG